MFQLVSTESNSICLFFLFRNKTINLAHLFRKWVMSRTGIAIDRLVNAQLRHMPGSEYARCGEVYIIFILATDTMSASCIIQFGLTKFV